MSYLSKWNKLKWQHIQLQAFRNPWGNYVISITMEMELEMFMDIYEIWISHENDLNTFFCLSLGRIRAPGKEGFHFSQCLSMLQTYRFIPRDLTMARQWSTQGKYFPSFWVPMANSMPSRNTSQIGKQKNPHTHLYFSATQATIFTRKIPFLIAFKLLFHFFSCCSHEIFIYISFASSLVSLPIPL